MQGYMMGHSVSLPTHAAMKYGGQMAKTVFFLILTMNHGLLVEVAKILQLQ